MNISRLLKHIFYPRWRLHQLFSNDTLANIETAISTSEVTHSGEIRFAIESSLPFETIYQGKTVRSRAIDVFSLLRVWDTENNNGVLIYILLVEHKVEIVADRNINQKVAKEKWQHICYIMEQEFKREHFDKGSVKGIKEVTTILAKHFPAGTNNKNELPNKPVIL